MSTHKTLSCASSEWTITWGPGGHPSYHPDGLAYSTYQNDGIVDDYYIGDFSRYPEQRGIYVIFEHPGYFASSNPDIIDLDNFYGILALKESTVSSADSDSCPTGTASDCEATIYLHYW